MQYKVRQAIHETTLAARKYRTSQMSLKPKSAWHGHGSKPPPNASALLLRLARSSPL